MYNELQFGTRSPNPKKECVFVWIYARNCTPYANYPYNDIPNVSLVLTEMRWDGLLGAVGGAVELDESLEYAIQRECIEEINYELPIDRIEPLLTVYNDESKFYIHSFSLEVSYEELLLIRKNAYGGEHFDAENAGINLLHICQYKKGKNEAGYNNIMEQNFVSSSKVELQTLVENKQLLVSYL